MFLFLSKLIPVLIFPVGLASLLLLAAVWVRKSKWRKPLLWAGVLLLWVFGNDWVAAGLVRSLEWQYLPQKSYPQADAIVILGGGTLPIEYPRSTVELNFAGDRMLYGARLYREGYAPIMIVTGGHLPWTDTHRSPADDMLDLLVFLGVPESNVILEGQSVNTYENALFTREILSGTGVEEIILVTSAMHMPRSVPLFEAQGFTVIPAPTDYNVTVSQDQKPLSETWPNLLFRIFPNAYALHDSSLALKEYVGIAVYSLRGWR